jgi:hypothetical protein
MEQAVGVIHPLPVRAPFETGPCLRVLTIVGLDPGYDAVFNVYLEATTPAAVTRAGGHYRPFFCCIFIHLSPPIAFTKYL